jgi:hypothetical protein
MEFEIINKINKTREYLDYLENHIENIKKAFEIIKEKCKDMRFIYDDFFYSEFIRQIEYHDISKMSDNEFTQYREHFSPTNKEIKYKDLPNEINICFLDSFKHHKENNSHHWENWAKKEFKEHPDYWEIHCAHMIVDWMAMSFKFGDTAKEFYENNKSIIKLPDYAIVFIYDIFDRFTNEQKDRNINT